MTSPPSTGSDSLTCPQCHKHVDQAAWVMHPRYCTAADPAGSASPDCHDRSGRIWWSRLRQTGCAEGVRGDLMYLIVGASFSS